MQKLAARMSFTVSADEKAKMKAAAKARGISLSQLIRDATHPTRLGQSA